VGELLRVVRGRSKVQLRVSGPYLARAADKLKLPTEPLSVTGSDPRLMWLAPDQWLLTSDREPADRLISWCRDEMASLVHCATDATAALSLFRVEHEKADVLLAMGCGLDFGSLSPGQCARTRLARIASIIVPIRAGTYEVYVDRSYTQYLQDWITLSGRDPIFAAAS